MLVPRSELLTGLELRIGGTDDGWARKKLESKEVTGLTSLLRKHIPEPLKPLLRWLAEHVPVLPSSSRWVCAAALTTQAN